MALSGTVDSARARRALFGWVALMAPEMALRTAVSRWGWEMSGAHLAALAGPEADLAVWVFLRVA